MITKEYTLDGLICAGCATKIYNAVSKHNELELVSFSNKKLKINTAEL